MALKLLRVPFLAAALGFLGSGGAFGHEALDRTSTLNPSLTPQLPGVATLAVASGLAVLALLGTWFMQRPDNVPFRRRWTRAHRDGAGALAGGVLVLLIWVLPWLSYHGTHHALENGEVTCPIAQIGHSQPGGILPSALALVSHGVAVAIVLPAPVALPTRAVPQPAARSPPA